VNDTGLEIARALDGGASIDEVVSSLVSRYAITEEQARRDVDYLSRELAKAHFVPNAAESSTPTTRAMGSLFVHLTTRCNLACPHCYYACPDQAREKPCDLDTAAVRRIIDEAMDEGAGSVALSGGEPFLHPDFEKIISHAASGLDIDVLTNGTLIDRQKAALLAGLGASVQISLDGSTAEIHDSHRGKGSFERVLRAVGFLQEAGAGERLNFCTTLMSQNLNDLKEIIRLSERLGVGLVRFIPLRQKGSAQRTWASIGSGVVVEDHEAFYRYTEELKEKGACSIGVSCGLSGFVLKVDSDDGIWCPAGNQLVVDVTGDVYPCVLLMRDEDRLGNIHHHSLATIRGSDGMARFCNTLASRRRKIEECAACSWRNLCQAGCMGLALEQKGTLWDRDLFCDYRKNAYERAFGRLLSRTIS